MSTKKVSKKILLIEDDPDQIFLYSTKFKLDGFTIVNANNGEMGITLASAEHPDVILLDMVMDNMTGIEVLQHLKADDKTKNIPVIILSNLAKKELRKQAEELGAVDFWAKSEVMPAEIVNRIKKVLQVK